MPKAPADVLNIPVGFRLGMLQDPETRIFSRTNDSSQNTDIPVNFAVIPRYTHDDNLAWFLVGTVKLDANSTLKLRLQKLSGEIVVDGFKLSPHVAKEVMEYDHANRAIHSTLYSERLSTPRAETYYVYDVVGKLVATRIHDFVEGSTSTTGYGYQGRQQVFSFGMDDPQADYQKIENFNLIGVQGDVLAFESTRFNSTTLTNEPRTVWQFNNLDGTKFVDDRGWSTSDYAFAGQRHAASNTDYLVQSRDSARRTWSGESEHGSVGYAAVEAFFGSIGGSLSRFGNGLLQLGANAVDTAMIGLNAATTLGGFEWQYRALGATGQAVEANELTTSDIVYNVGAGLGTMALDTVSLGGYATYQYNVGLITAEEAGDRFIGLGLMALGGAGSLRAAGLTKMTVGQAGKVVTNAITHPVSTVKALGGMIQTVVAPTSGMEGAIGFAPGYAQGIANKGLRKSFRKAMNSVGAKVKFVTEGDSYFNPRTMTAVINKKTATPGTLLDEFTHAFSRMHGKGRYLSEELAEVHKALANRVKVLGSTDRLGLADNTLYHQLELLNFMNSSMKKPGFIKVIPQEEISRFLSPLEMNGPLGGIGR